MNRLNTKTLPRSWVAVGISMLMATSAWAQEPAAAKAALNGNAAAGAKIAQSGSAGGAAACITCEHAIIIPIAAVSLIKFFLLISLSCLS